MGRRWEGIGVSEDLLERWHVDRYVCSGGEFEDFCRLRSWIGRANVDIGTCEVEARARG